MHVIIFPPIPLLFWIAVSRAAPAPSIDPLGAPMPVQPGIEPIAVWTLVALAAALGMLATALLSLLIPPRRRRPHAHVGQRRQDIRHGHHHPGAPSAHLDAGHGDERPGGRKGPPG
jgi:hypothetical protein